MPTSFDEARCSIGPDREEASDGLPHGSLERWHDLAITAANADEALR